MAYKQGKRRRLIDGLNKRFKTSYILFEFTRILKLQNIVEIRINFNAT